MGHKWIQNAKHVTFEPEKDIYFSTYPPPTLIHLSHRFISASKPAEQKSSDCCLSHFRTWPGIICDFQTFFRKYLDPVVNCFTRQTFFTGKTKYSLTNNLCIVTFCQQKRTTECCTLVVYSSSAVAILTTETSL
jgi:hypothetical protein